MKVLLLKVDFMKKLFFVFTCFLLSSWMAISQTKQAAGTVRDETGEPVIGATVIAKGTSAGTVTKSDGTFSLEVPETVTTLLIRYIGYTDAEVNVSGNVALTLLPDAKQLDEVIVVAFGSSTKRSFTGSAAVIRSEDIYKRQSSNLSNSLAGQVAGVQGISSNGQPGKGSSIRIRGIGSMYASNNPLYVIDGMPYDGSLAAVNNADIESITVLKDAASNALYGARGANGVIMITTKRGKNREAQIQVDAKWGSNSRAVPSYRVMTDPGMYYEKYYEALYNSRFCVNGNAAAAHDFAGKTLLDASNGGLGYLVYTVPEGERLIGTDGKLNPAATPGYSDGKNTFLADNWYRELFNSGNLRQEYNVSISGNDDKFRFYASAGYLEDGGIIQNSDFTRLSTRLNAEYQAKKWLKIGINMSYARTQSRDPDDQTNTVSSKNIFFLTTSIAPIYPLYVRDGEGQVMKDRNGFTVYDYGDGKTTAARRPFMSRSNPASAIALDMRDYESDVFSGKYSVAIDIYPGLKATANFGLYASNERIRQLKNPYYGQFAEMGGQVNAKHTRFFSVNRQYLLTYTNGFDGHNVDLLAGYERYDYKSRFLQGSKVKLFQPDVAEISNAILQPSVGSSSAYYATSGFLARAQYDYDGKYFASLSYRRDGSSVFHPDRRWGNFWSAGLAWIVNREKFMEALPVFNLLKVKASYGAQGNDNLQSNGSRNRYPYLDQYEVSESNGEFSTSLTFKGNKDITWETSHNFNTGIDFSLLNERLGGSVEFFSRKTKDMLYYRPVPPSFGYSQLPVNIGSLRNSGLEVELHGDVIKNRFLDWKVYANLTCWQNRIIRLDPSLNGKWISGSYIYREGGSLNNFYIRRPAGVDKETGEALWYKDVKDADGKVTGQTTTRLWAEGTPYESGDVSPKVYGGFGTSVEVKGFDFSVAFTYQLGGRVYDNTYANLMHSGNSTGENWHRDILNSWTPEKRNTNVPRVNVLDDNVNSTSSRFLIRSDFLGLQNITLGYTLPANITGRAKIGRLRIYGVADNVFLFSARRGFDPRQGFKTSSAAYYSPVRSISGGINLSF
jgi:TonB-linked SusC/RagA family outer membrane protein